MATGLVVYNSNGRVQIDSDTPTYFLIKSGSLQTASITITAVHPICAVRGNGVTVRSQTNNGNGTWTILFFRAPSSTGTYYVYDMRLPTAGATFGIVLYNASGEITYTSAQYPMAITTVGEIPDGVYGAQISAPSLTISGLDASRQYAAFFYNTRSFALRERISPNNYIWGSLKDCVFTNSTSVVVEFTYLGGFPQPFVPNALRGGFCTVIDVTNIPTTFDI